MGRTSPEILKQIVLRLSYCPIDGTFTRLVSVNKFKAGEIAGSILVTESGQLYIEIGACSYRYLGHKLAWWIMTKEYPNFELDHFDGNGLNNKWSNLRKATRSENSCNVKKHSDGFCDYKGVTFDKSRNLYQARIMKDGKQIHIGRFKTQQLAFEAYKEKSIELHKEFGTTRGSKGYGNKNSQYSRPDS